MWVKVDDRFPEHPKVVAAGMKLGPYGEGRVLALWLHGMCYCNRNYTDGWLEATTIATWMRIDRKPLEVAEAMAQPVRDKAGLLVKEGEGDLARFRFHDYEVHNPTLEEAIERKEKDRDRKRQKRHGEHPAEAPSETVQTDAVQHVSAGNPNGHTRNSDWNPNGQIRDESDDVRVESDRIPNASRARDPAPAPAPNGEGHKFTGRAARAGIRVPVENARVLKAVVWRESHAIYNNPNEEWSLPNLVELLKCKAAGVGLVYDGDAFRDQVEIAFTRVPLQYRRSA